MLTHSAMKCIEETKVNFKAHFKKMSDCRSNNHPKVKRKYRKLGNAHHCQVKKNQNNE